jgi:site-specific DNA-methyltransferase (adenine-specific)
MSDIKDGLYLDEIYHNDCFDVMRAISDKEIDLILTDIPYDAVNRESNGIRNFDKGSADVLTFDLQAFLTECIRVCRGSFYIFCGKEQVSEIFKRFADEKLSPRLIVWEKTNPSPVNGQYLWLSGVEVAVYGKFPKATFTEHCKNTVLRFPVGRSKRHPTEKPLPLFEHLIKVSSKEGDIVYDPCIGSGTTAEAAKNLNRHFIGSDISADFIKMAKERVGIDQARRS